VPSTMWALTVSMSFRQLAAAQIGSSGPA